MRSQAVATVSLLKIWGRRFAMCSSTCGLDGRSRCVPLTSMFFRFGPSSKRQPSHSAIWSLFVKSETYRTLSLRLLLTSDMNWQSHLPLKHPRSVPRRMLFAKPNPLAAISMRRCMRICLSGDPSRNTPLT